MKTCKIKKFILSGLVILIALSTFTACKDDTASTGSNPKVQMEMENGDKFIIELYPEYAPETVENFVKLVKNGFYDGLTFHRIVDGFMAQGGGFDINGNKIEAETIKGEFANNGFTQNTLKHTKGVISMARVGGMNDSASSEFFIMYGTTSSLDGDYAAFGEVIEGMEIINAFQELERTMNSMGEIATPVVPVVIKKATVLD